MTARLWPNKLGYDVDNHEVWIHRDGLGVRTWDTRLGYFTRTAWIADPSVSPVAAVRACLEHGTLIESIPVDMLPLEVNRLITISAVQETLFC
jgi:hypothetical protein